MKPTTGFVVALLVIILVLLGLVFLQQTSQPEIVVDIPTEVSVPEVIVATSSQSIIGTSVEGRNIEAYTFGTGETAVLFVGGVHGGYEWNSSLLAYELIDYLHTNANVIPSNQTVHIIPTLNPDGLFTITKQEGRFTALNIPSTDFYSTGTGRFNANNVDLNRNFDCKWAPESSWRGQTVSAGSAPFSEPEAIALRDYVLTINPKAVVFWHSRANNVYASECENGILPSTLTLMSTYAKAANYGEVPKFDAYPVTGDAEGWLASIGIPAVTVELETRDSIEWERNLAGTLATLQLFSAN